MFLLLGLTSCTKVCIVKDAKKCPEGFAPWANQTDVSEIYVLDQNYKLDVQYLNASSVTLTLGSSNFTLYTSSNDSVDIDYLELYNQTLKEQSIFIIDGNITIHKVNSHGSVSLFNGTYGDISGVVSNFSVDFLPNSTYYREMTETITTFYKIPQNMPNIVFKQEYVNGIPRYLQTFFYGSKEELNNLEKNIENIFVFQKTVGTKQFWIHHQKTTKYITVYLSNIDGFMKTLMWISIGSASFAIFLFIVCVVSYFWQSPPKEAKSAYMVLP